MGNLWRSIFNISRQHRNTSDGLLGILFSLKKVVFYLETERFLAIIGDKSRKSDCKLTDLAAD